MPSDCKIAGHCKAFSQPSLSQNQEAVPVRLGTTTVVADGTSRAHLLPRFFRTPATADTPSLHLRPQEPQDLRKQDVKRRLPTSSYLSPDHSAQELSAVERLIE